MAAPQPPTPSSSSQPLVHPQSIRAQPQPPQYPPPRPIGHTLAQQPQQPQYPPPRPVGYPAAANSNSNSTTYDVTEPSWVSGSCYVPPSGPSSLIHPDSVRSQQQLAPPVSEYDVKYVPMPELRHDLIRLAPIGDRSETAKYVLRQGEVENPDALRADRRTYSPDKLNEMQRTIYDWAKSNPTDIAIIQAGPGCGKSFTLLTIATTTVGDVVIYKRDLLDMFMMQMRRFTVCQFGMTTFDLDFCGWKGLEKTVSSNMTPMEFMLMITGMLARARLPNLAGGLVLLDEYTVISKPVLVAMLILLEAYGIGTLMCGDRNQLQNIFNSRHAPLSAYELGCSFAKHQFTLKENIRCQNQYYRDIIDMMAELSSERKLDDYAYAIVAAVFPQQLLAETCYSHTHLAGAHSDLTWLAHTLVIKETIPHSYYLLDTQGTCEVHPDKIIMPDEMKAYLENNGIDPATGRPFPNRRQPCVWIGRFPPYLPLKVGARYYVRRYSEQSMCTLESLVYNDRGEVIGAYVRNDSNPTELEELRRENCDAVMFDQHREELMKNYEIPNTMRRGHLTNIPLYPANFFTIHRSQGITIANSPVDIILSSQGTTYRSLYVAMSRVKSQDQIARVYILPQQKFLLSTVLNFKSFSLDPNFRVTADMLRARLPYDYTIWEPSDGVDATLIAADLADFWKSRDPAQRIKLAMSLLMRSKPVANLGLRTARISHFDQALVHVVRHRDVFRALACLGQRDRIVWLREWTTLDPRVSAGPVHTSTICESAQAAYFRVKKCIDELKKGDYHELNRKRKHVPLDPTTKKGDAVSADDLENAKSSKMLGVTGVLDVDNFNSTVEFIFDRSCIVDRSSDPKAGREYAIAQITDDLWLETSPFRAEVFHLHREAFEGQKRSVRTYPITIPWLFDKLNWLLEHPHHDPDETPSYEPRPKKERAAKATKAADDDDDTPRKPRAGYKRATNGARNHNYKRSK